MIPAHPPARPPPAPDFDPEKAFAALLALAQRGLDLMLSAPRWTAFALLLFALALTALGRHGQRLLAGSALACGVVAFAVLFLRPQAPDASWPGMVAVIGGGAALALGLGVPGWTTALVSAVACGAAGALLAVDVAHAQWLVGALPGALLGLFLGLANHLFWGLWMPPIFAALSAVLAAARLAAVPAAGSPAMIPQLARAEWALASWCVLAIMLLAVSLERDHLRKKRAAAKSKAEADAELAAKLKRDRERHAKYIGSKYGA